MDPLQNPAYLIASAVSPLLIAFAKQSGWSRQTNAVVAFLGYVVVGIAGAVMSGTPLTLENLVPLITTATMVGSVFYRLLWDNLGTTTPNAPSVEERITEATSVVK